MTLREGLSQIGDTATRALASESLVAEVARTLTHAERILTVARGLHLSTAIEAALKLAETSYIAAQPFSSADLLHGPIASVAPNTPCLLFAPNGATAAGMDALDAKLREKQARVLRLSGARAEAVADAAAGHLTLPLADPGTELLAPLVDILPAQLLAFHLARARGLDPDRPRGLTKVTITR
jgi:glucosamine--fructose-6-phosphate aminotransferase (isomerizing)